MSDKTLAAFEELLIDGNIVNIEEDLFDMYNNTLSSQDQLGKLTDSCIISYLHTIRSVVKALRLVEAENQFNLKNVS